MNPSDHLESTLVRRSCDLTFAALEKAGYKSAELEKIMGGNWIRVLKENLG